MHIAQSARNVSQAATVRLHDGGSSVVSAVAHGAGPLTEFSQPVSPRTRVLCRYLQFPLDCCRFSHSVRQTHGLIGLRARRRRTPVSSAIANRSRRDSLGTN